LLLLLPLLLSLVSLSPCSLCPIGVVASCIRRYWHFSGSRWRWHRRCGSGLGDASMMLAGHVVVVRSRKQEQRHRDRSAVVIQSTVRRRTARAEANRYVAWHFSTAIMRPCPRALMSWCRAMSYHIVSRRIVSCPVVLCCAVPCCITPPHWMPFCVPAILLQSPTAASRCGSGHSGTSPATGCDEIC
jgi:hypothetical protein